MLETNSAKKSKKMDSSYLIEKQSLRLSFSKNELESINNALKKINNKKFGKPITLKDFTMFFANNHRQSDVRRMQKESFTLDDKLMMKLVEFNKRNNKELTMEVFLAKKLKL